ncbi:MAG: hypothetical protein WBP59_12215 [Ilumatobacteraceae bacterium]
MSASLGVDGGPIFQILAVENLGLSATAIGIAFGLGVVSLPIQIYAARIPIERARHNMQIFLALGALQAWVLAFLVGVGATGGFAAIALGVTVTAEISVSVLFATAWQPLLASGLDTHGRQRLNSTWPAVARGVLAAALVLFAALDSGGRTLFLVVIGVLAVATAVGMNAIDPPPRAPHDEPDSVTTAAACSATATRPATSRTALAPATRVVLVVFAVINIGAIPLWLVYLNKVLWPSADLGAIAAVQIGAAMIALLAWKATDGDVTRRALIGAGINLAAVVSIVVLDGPVSSLAQQSVVVVATAVMAAGVTTARLAMVEATHRVVTPANTVRAFTLLDVVASTSLQAGLLIGGLLITASADADASLTDPYRAFVFVATATTIPAIWWFKKTSGQQQALAGRRRMP